MNKIFKKIWNQSRGCFVAVSEAMATANQCSGKAVVIGSLGLLLLANVQAADEYTHEGDYYKRDHSGPYNNTHDYTKATHMTITGSYFHLETTLITGMTALSLVLQIIEAADMPQVH